MIRLGGKYQHLVHGDGCGCFSPALQHATKRLDAFSRRGFLAGLGATVAAAAATRGDAFAQAGAPSRTFFTNARLFDGRADSLQSGMQVLVEGDRIAAIDAANNPAPDGATVIDCADRVLMPGLIDAHWHSIFAAVPLPILITGDPGIVFASSTAEAERTLMRGFTTVRDLGGPVFSFKQAIDNGIIPGPRIFPSGAMITTTGGHGDLRLPTEIPRDGNQLSVGELFGGAAIVDSVGDLQLRVREQFRQGASQIKLTAGGGVSSPVSPLDMTSFSEDDLRAAVNIARDWNSYVTVHAYMPNTVQRAIAAGVSCVEHAHLMDEETARLFIDNDVWLCMQPFLTMEDASSQTGPGVERAKQIFEGTPRAYELIRKHGIKTGWGSDVLFSPELTPRQNVMLTHLSNWYSNAEALKMATSTNAELLALSNMRTPYPRKVGVIERDAFADMLVVDGNPLDDIRLLENPGDNLVVIMKNGRAHKNTL